MSNAVTSSVALTELKNDLTQLSRSLDVIYDLMNTDMRQVGEAWQDGKYQEFVEGYKPQIDKCKAISERYTEWCRRVLDPTIENVLAVEKTDVGVGGGSNVGGGAPRNVVSRPNNNAGANEQVKPATSSKFNMSGKVPTNANEACKADFGDNYKAVPAGADEPGASNLYVKNAQKGSDWSAGGKIEAGVKIGKFNISGGGDGRYNSGNETVESVRNTTYKCVPEENG